MSEKPRILFLDIETFPNLGYTWGKYDQSVLHFVKESELASIAWKWQGGLVECETRQGDKTDEALTAHAHQLLDDADIVVAHNGDNFDLKRLRSRMLYWGLTPPRPAATVDTLKVAKAYFSFNSNSLNDLCQYLKIGKKVPHTGIQLWLDCMAGKKAAWKTMVKYNKHDVVLLEAVYNQMLPYIQNHPHIGRLLNPHHTGLSCPHCGGWHSVKRGLRATHTSVQQQWRCPDCGAWFLTRLGKVEK